MTVTYHNETHHSKCSKCLLLALRHAIKQSRHWSIDWSMNSAGCWPYFNQMPFQLVDIPRWFLINMFLRFGFSRCLQVLVHWCRFHAARGESEWCIGLLLWCLAAQTVAARHLSSCFPVHHACTRAPSCCDTRLRTSHQTCGLPIDLPWSNYARCWRHSWQSQYSTVVLTAVRFMIAMYRK